MLIVIQLGMALGYNTEFSHNYEVQWFNVVPPIVLFSRRACGIEPCALACGPLARFLFRPCSSGLPASVTRSPTWKKVPPNTATSCT